MPRISVIIPTYNRAALLCETLDSVFAQTFHDYEIIVVDDGSTDDTHARLGALEQRIIYRRIDNSGQGAARNVGLDLARGEQIAFLDSDELWRPQFLERMSDTLDENLNAGFAYCDYATFDERGEGKSAHLTPTQKIRGNVFAQLLEEDFLCTGGLMFRRECFDRAGKFDPRLPPVEDWDLWLRIAHEYEAAYVDASLLRVRQNQAHASRNPEIIYTRNLQIFTKLERNFPNEARRFRPIVTRQKSNFHRALARHYGSRRQPLVAFKHMALAAATRFL